MSKVFAEKGWLSGSTRVTGASPVVTPPPPPPSGALRTMISGWHMPDTAWGTSPVPDAYLLVNGVSGATNTVSTSGIIDDMTAAGGCFFARVTSGNPLLKTSAGGFDPQKWKDSFDLWKTTVEGVSGGLQKLRDAVRVGVFRGLMGFDDLGASPNGFNPRITKAQIESCCSHVKVTRGWSWMPIMARCRNTQLKGFATINGVVQKYQYLDGGGCQFRHRQNVDGDPHSYIQAEIRAGQDIDLATLGHGNIHQGLPDPTWGDGCVESNGSVCGTSPKELREIGLAWLQYPEVQGFSVWSYAENPTYWNLAELQAAWLVIYNASIGRTDGPVNIRGDLTTPP